MPTIYTTPPEVILEAGRLKGKTARQIHDEEIAREDARYQANLDYKRQQDQDAMKLATVKELNNARKNEIDLIKFNKTYGLKAFDSATSRMKLFQNETDPEKILKSKQAQARIERAKTQFGGDYRKEQIDFKKSTQKLSDIQYIMQGIENQKSKEEKPSLEKEVEEAKKKGITIPPVHVYKEFTIEERSAWINDYTEDQRIEIINRIKKRNKGK